MHLLEDYLSYDATGTSNCHARGIAVLIEEVFLVLSGKMALGWVPLSTQL